MDTPMKLIPVAEELFKQCFETLKKKNQDYAGTDGEFKNFEDPTLRKYLPQHDDVILNIRGELRKKFTRMDTLIFESREANFESLDDTILDMVNYLIILAAYRKIQKAKSNA